MEVQIKKMLSARMMRMLLGGVVEMLGEKYDFSAIEALEWMQCDLSSKKVKEKKQYIPLPFMSVKDSNCKGCKMNKGLYTQCDNRRDENEDLCRSCMKEAENNENVLPYGRIEERAAAGNDYKDSKGRSPTPYMKVLEKLKITREEAVAYAVSIGIELPDSIFELPAKKAKEIRGRPKKAVKSVEVDSSEDLFAGLVQISLSETVSNDDLDSDSTDDKLAKKEALEAEKLAKKAALEAEKLAKKEALEADKLAKKEALEAEKLAKKEALEAEKLAKKEALEADKLAKKEALEAEKLAKKEALEAEKLAKKEALEAEKLAKKEALEADKLAKKAALEAEKQDKKDKKEKKEKKDKKESKVSVCVSETDDEEEEEEVSCTKFEFNGKTYLKSTKNVLYDMESQDEIGIWNDKEQKIEYSELSEDEEED
jgi:hypothetical protein